MIHLQVNIVGVNEKAPLEDIHPVAEAEFTHACILEKGTANGHTSVFFVLKMPDGTYINAQMTAGTYLMTAGILKGACQRWGDTKNT